MDNVAAIQIDKMNDGTCHVYVLQPKSFPEAGRIVKIGKFNPQTSDIVRFVFDLMGGETEND